MDIIDHLLNFLLLPWVGAAAPITIGGVVLGWMKKHSGGEWVDVIRNAFVGAASLVIVYQLGVVPFLESILPSPERVERNVERWLERAGIKGEKMIGPPESIEFQFNFDYRNEKLSAAISRKNDSILQVGSVIRLSQEHQDWLNSLTEENNNQQSWAMRQSLHQLTGIETDIKRIGQANPWEYRIDIVSNLPISSLNEKDFMEAVKSVYRGADVAKIAISFQMLKWEQ